MRRPMEAIRPGVHALVDRRHVAQMAIEIAHECQLLTDSASNRCPRHIVTQSIEPFDTITPPLIEPKNGSNQPSFAKALLGSWRPLFLSAGGTVSVVWRTLSSCHSPWIVCRHPFHEGRGGDGRPCRCSITRPLSLASSPSSTSSALNTSAFLLSPGSPLPSLQV